MYSHHLHVHGCCLGASWTRSSGSSGSPLQELSASGRRSTVGGGDVVAGQQQLVLVSSRKLFAPESSFLRCSASSTTSSSSGAPSSSSPPPPPPAPVVGDNAKKISSRTQKIMEKLVGAAGGNQAGGAGGASSYEALKKLDQQWLQMRSMTTTAQVSGSRPEVVTRWPGPWGGAESSSAAGMMMMATRKKQRSQEEEEVFDAVVCGGTLGVFLATVLALKGMKVAIVERGPLRGRVQEWNVSRKELKELVKMGVLTDAELEDVIAVEFNPSRVGFDGGTEVWVKDILNLGVSPEKLIAICKKRFLGAGGVVLEGTGVSKVNVFDDAAVVLLDDGTTLVSRLILDVMGNSSPIVRQIRWGQRPDGVCLVVGTCARGFENNSTSDLIYTRTPVTQVGSSKTQYFWEAFPAGSGPRDRTTYMFTYLDATPNRPSFEQMLEDYWDLMPPYQGIKLEDVEILRVLFGLFPTYQSSPLPAAFDRILQVGDASGIQSPISFGGFAAITRHLSRLSSGLMDALESDLLDKENLALLNPYLPNLSGVWMYQRAMSVRLDINPSPDFINNLLSINFQCMEKLGDPVIRPFLQDVIQFVPQAKLLISIMVNKPLFIPQILQQVGFLPLLDWTRHFVALAAYSVLWLAIAPSLLSWVESLPKEKQYVWRRQLEAWQYGSGFDYKG